MDFHLLNDKLKEIISCQHQFKKTSEEFTSENKFAKYYKCGKCKLIAKSVKLINEYEEVNYTKFDFCVDDKIEF